jgi:hypothetical protein
MLSGDNIKVAATVTFDKISWKHFIW